MRKKENEEIVETFQEEEPIEEKPVEEIKGRKEEDYFFPKQRKTVKATSLEEAIKKLKQNDY